MNEDTQTKSSRWKRVGWFVLIWLCSTAALGLAALAMRALMGLAGLTAG